MKINLLTITTGIILALAGCKAQAPEEFSVIPYPQFTELKDGAFKVAGAKFNAGPDLPAEALEAIKGFANASVKMTGCGKATVGNDTSAETGFVFIINENLPEEGYAITIEDRKASIEAYKTAGFLYAIETLKQMLPAEIYSGAKVRGATLPCCSIIDYPRFGYRGAMLDSGRHFWEIDEVKRFIDIMAVYKMNRLHWHLSEDQGWRVEIKKYPRLTEVGAWRNGTMIEKDWSSNDGIRYGGFYTQDQLRDVVQYAQAKGITIIPEIDLPGHMVAALASYPELGCTGGPYEVRTVWGISNQILCAGNEQVFTFLSDVFDELTDIFPSEYIHVGGDECFPGGSDYPWDTCPKCQARMKELGIKKGPDAKQHLQNYVTARVQKMLEDKGRKIIGWDEILEGNLAPGATVMSWRGVKGGIEASAKGFDVIMSPNSHMYIDYYQSKEKDKEPLAIGGYLPIEKVYSYEPFEGMAEGAEDHILGVQCNLWTEYIATPEYLEYMLLPRMCAAAEVGWSEASDKDFDRFNAALDHTFKIFDALGYTYCKDVRGIIGLPGNEQPAAESEEPKN